MLHLLPYCIPFILNVFSWCTAAIFLYFFRVVSCCIFSKGYTFWSRTFLRCTFLTSFHIAPFVVLNSFHVAHFLFCISFPVALFSCCNFFMLHFFPVWTFIFDLFLVLAFFALFFAAFPRTAHFLHCNLSRCTYLILHLFPEAHLSYDTLFTLHFPRAWKWQLY